MKARAFEFHLNGVRGIPRVLLIVLISALILGVISLVVMIGMAVTVVGLTVSAVAMLWFAVKRALLPGGAGFFSPVPGPQKARSSESPTMEAIDVEVEVLPIRERSSGVNEPPKA